MTAGAKTSGSEPLKRTSTAALTGGPILHPPQLHAGIGMMSRELLWVLAINSADVRCSGTDNELGIVFMLHFNDIGHVKRGLLLEPTVLLLE